jgi:thiamine-phosphate pyrophosphorylase
MLVTDRRLAGGDDALGETVAEAVTGGVTAVQLREKDLDDSVLKGLALRVRHAIAGRALFIVNGPPRAAAQVGADGLHLPDDAPPLASPPSNMLLGRSVHSVEAARQAEAEGVSYLVFGPVYETVSHPGIPGTGLDALTEVVGAVSIPVLAIGGITAQMAGDIMGAGASGVAVISAILGSPSPRKAASELRRAIDRHSHGHNAKRQTSRT